MVIDYTDCRDKAPNGTDFVAMPKGLVTSAFTGSKTGCPAGAGPQWAGNSTTITYPGGGDPVDTHICSVRFDIPTNLNPPVLLYYRLTNFYQNHRRYVKSLDSNQLKGQAVNSTSDCSPLQTGPNGKNIYPCGLIANSVFNDTFSNPMQLNVHYSNADKRPYNMTTQGIAWDSDTQKLYGKTQYKPADIEPPPNWFLRYQKGYSDDVPPPNLQEDYAFQVWMRTAGLPSFSKLALRNDNETMQCSSYQVDITNSWYSRLRGDTQY